MALPPVEELSRWTVGRVTSWLAENSLTAFRDDFLQEGIDGSKLMKINGQEIDQKYRYIDSKKRNFLKDHLSRIQSSRHPPSWSVTPPQLPPRPGGVGHGPRALAPLPACDDDEESDDGWKSDEFDQDDCEEEYLEPTTKPPHLAPPPPVPRHTLNGQHRPLPPDPTEPQTEYEIPAEELEELAVRHHHPSTSLDRKPTLVDRLKNELAIRNSKVEHKSTDHNNVEHKSTDHNNDNQATSSGSDSDGDSYIEPFPGPCCEIPDAVTPPPRPPRGRPLPEGPSYKNAPAESAPRPSASPAVSQSAHAPPHLPPLPAQPVKNTFPPEDVYEIMTNESTKPENDDGDYTHPDVTITMPNSYLDFSETCKKTQDTPHRRDPPKPATGPSAVDAELPPRPVKKVSTEKSPQQPGGWLFNSEQAAKTGDDLSAYEWYHGKITRDHAQKIFIREQKDGMFLIRKSERDPQQPYTLVIWHCNRIWNLPIRKLHNGLYAAGKHKADETQFKTIVELVEHFKVVSLCLKSTADHVEGSNRLTIPAPKY